MEATQSGPGRSDAATAGAHHDSPLPFAFGAAGTFAPLLVLLWNDPLTRTGFHKFEMWGLGASMLSGLVSASVGMLLRGTRRWTAFFVVAMGFGTAFGTFVAGATSPAGPQVLPAVVPVAATCALVLTTAAAATFAAHRRLLAVRPQSLLAYIEGSRIWSATGAVVIGVAWLVDVAASQASVLRLAAAAVAFAGIVGTVIARRRDVADLHAAMRQAGERVDERADRETLHDLGVGDDMWRCGPATAPYRTAGTPLPVIRGSLAAARRRARWVALTDIVTTLSALLALLCMAWLAAVRGFGGPRVPPAAPPPVAASAPPPVPTGSWYPDQRPILADINRDGVEDVVSLRWNEADPATALFVSAYDGTTFQPLWATKRVPSQWMSRATHLVRSGNVLFLSDSERQLYIYDLATGRRLHEPLRVDGSGSLCVPGGDAPALWVADRDGFRLDAAGELIHADARVTKAPRPKHCTEVTAPMFFSAIGRWDSRCAKKLHTPGLRGVMFRREGDVGLGLDYSGDDPFAIGYAPATCRRRWRSPLAFTSDALHPSPHLENRLTGGRLYTLYQLESGRWEVGARDAKSGDVAWHSTLPEAERGTNVQTLFVSAQRVYVARDWRLDVLALHDGRYLGRM